MAFSGHGALFDAEGREIDASPAFILEVQRQYIDHLYGAADESTRSAFDAKRQGVLAGRALSESDQIHANAALIAWLIAEARPANAGRLAGLNAALRNQLTAERRTARAGTAADAGPSEALSRRLAEQGLSATPAAVGSSGDHYIADCQAAGVPIPPDWGSPEWQFRGDLQNPFIFSTTKKAKVFVFESPAPRGLCIALPRLDLGESFIQPLGIICQGNDTSRACFWDKQTSTPTGAPAPLSEFLSGATLTDRCTDCHAGRNAFIVHPGTPLDLGSALNANDWYVPLVPPDFSQNVGPTTRFDIIGLGAGEGSCLGCHQLPELSSAIGSYCVSVLANAVKKTMPPAGSPRDPDPVDPDAAARLTSRPRRRRSIRQPGGDAPMKHDAPPGAMARRKRAIAAITVAGALTSLPAANVRAVETSFVCTPTSLSIFAGHTSIRCTPKQGQIEFFALGYANSDQADRLLSVASTAFALKKKLTIFYDPDDTSGTSVGCLAKDCRLLRGLIMF